MSGFCPDDFHGTTEADLQAMSWGEDYHYWTDVSASVDRHWRGAASATDRLNQREQYAVHDAAIALAKADSLIFHALPLDAQVEYLNAATLARGQS